MNKVVILYASYGDGHLQAARALKDAFHLAGGATIVMIDLMAEAHPWINEMTKRIYRKSYTFMPSLYGWVYDITRPMKHDSLFSSWLHSFGSQAVRRIIKQEQPDYIIHTFPMLAALSSKPVMRRVPSCTVITDFDLHRRWVHPGVDQYYVATDDLLGELAALGIPEQKIKAAGIPIHPCFENLSRLDSHSIRLKHGFAADSSIVMIMAGAQSAFPGIWSLCNGLLEHERVEVALLCGNQATLSSHIHQAFAQDERRHRLHLFNYMTNIHEFMAISHCIITKPGGMTLSESIAARLPILVYRPVPGQELNNARYLARKSALTICNDIATLKNEVIALVDRPELRSRRQSALHRLHRPYAAQAITLDIMENLAIMKREAQHVVR